MARRSAMPNMSKTSRSMASVPGHRSNSEGSVGVVGGHLHPDPQARAVVEVDEVDDDFEALGVDTLGQDRGRGA